jgi:hypothetical protein
MKLSAMVLLATVLLTSPLSATTTISARTLKQIVLAADSKILGSNTPACKIGRDKVSGIFFTFSGLSDPTRGYDVGKIIQEGLSKQGTFNQRVENTKKLFQRLLPIEIEKLRRDRPGDYEEMIEHRPTLVGIAFAAYAENQLRLINLEFQIDQKTRRIKAPVVDSCPGTCANGSMSVINGLHDAIDLYLMGGDANVADFPALIQREIVDRPDAVGPPINILAIYPNKYEWLLNGDVCKAELP